MRNTRGVLVAVGAATALMAVALPGMPWPAGPARAIELAVARKCLALTMKEYPRPKDYAAYKPGNPATARAREAYYRDCVAKETTAQAAAAAPR